MAKKSPFELSDVIYALQNAAEFLDNSEFPDGTGVQEAANKDAARRILLLKDRLLAKATHLRDPNIPKSATFCGRILINPDHYEFSTTPTCLHCLRKMERNARARKPSHLG